jgi:asparagine synthase (glutamine-hydrolysing)
LDNRAELIGDLRDVLSFDSTDVAIVSAAYERWGIDFLSRLIGDWALSIWNPFSRSLTLAKDPVGIRHLYYAVDKNQVTWCTILDPLVQFAARTFDLNEEYIAGWFSMFPAAHLTPYLGIHSVPPSSSVLLRPGKHTISKYWDFDAAKRIRYRTDPEYEEHFRAVFAQAVQCRLRSDCPILAELSGGMDSSSIVCMADILIARAAAETTRLDTISWYDDSNPGVDERPYFTKVEEKRGRTGCHIDLGALRETERRPQGSLAPKSERDLFLATPTRCRPPSKLFKPYAAYITSQAHRVVFSGIGGGEITGSGVPTPKPELQNLLARARFFTLAYQLKAWALKMRKPRLPLLWEAVREFFPVGLVGVTEITRSAPWFRTDFARRNHAALCGYRSRLRLLGPLPCFQHNIAQLEDLRRLLADWNLESERLHERRYPYLDRDFLEFMYAIPREQVVRLGQRRSLMRRALVGIVPDELLNRRQRAFVQQETPKSVLAQWLTSPEITLQTLGDATGIMDSDRFAEALQEGQQNGEIPLGSIMRTLTLEAWLRHLIMQGVLTTSLRMTKQVYSSPLRANEIQASAQPKSSAS